MGSIKEIILSMLLSALACWLVLGLPHLGVSLMPASGLITLILVVAFFPLLFAFSKIGVRYGYEASITRNRPHWVSLFRLTCSRRGRPDKVLLLW